MTLKSIIFSVAIIIIIVVAIIVGIFYYYQTNKLVVQQPVVQQPKTEKSSVIDPALGAQIEQNYNEAFPDVVEGKINIISNTRSTIKTDSTEYLISPAKTISFYSNSGVQSGDTVIIRGKITEAKLTIGSIVKK